jgi:solute carrier family 25 citrate transporter 1
MRADGGGDGGDGADALGVAREGARGAIAGVLARAVTHPLDTMKARAQVMGAVTRARSPSRATTVGTIGARGLYAGFGAVAVFAPFASGAYFIGLESGSRWFGDGALGAAATGAWAQALAGVVYTPMDVIKERLQTQNVLSANARAGAYKHWVDAGRMIIREEGAFRGLFRGYWAQNFVWWPWSAMYFVIYDASRRAFANSDDNVIAPWVSSACATVAAAAATTATHPLDLAKTRVQTMKFAPGEESLVRVLRNVVAREGVRGLFAGVSARVASVAPGSAISFYIYETLKQMDDSR